MTNWAAINDLVEEDENEKRKLVYSPGICQRPGRLFLKASFLLALLLIVNVSPTFRH